MRIHTTLDRHTMLHLTKDLPCWYESLTEHGSRSHVRAFEVRLSGSSPHRSQGGDYSAATWDEWGAFFGRLYSFDQTALCGGRNGYLNADNYHWQTGGRFMDGILPPDTHPRHRWSWDGASATGTYEVYHCTGCSAHMRRVAYGHDWTEIAA